VKSVTLQAPQLELVSISYDPFYRKSHAEIKLYASALAKFRYAGYMAEALLLDAHSVASADITLYNIKKSVQEIENFVYKLLSINPESLKLQMFGSTLQVSFIFFLRHPLFSINIMTSFFTSVKFWFVIFIST